MAVIMTNLFFSDLAKIVRYHRKQSGLSRIDLAQMAGVGKTVLYDIEHEKSTVRLDTLIKILKVLNITIELKGPLMQINSGIMSNEKS